jgi:hypothetical protein
MKKQVKKLVLAKETVRNLGGGLRRVCGGTLGYTDPGVCGGPNTYYNSCLRYCLPEPIRED